MVRGLIDTVFGKVEERTGVAFIANNDLERFWDIVAFHVQVARDVSERWGFCVHHLDGARLASHVACTVKSTPSASQRVSARAVALNAFFREDNSQVLITCALAVVGGLHEGWWRHIGARCLEVAGRNTKESWRFSVLDKDLLGLGDGVATSVSCSPSASDGDEVVALL